MKLRTYGKFKVNLEKENYLKILRKFEYRKYLTRFRISAHTLEIETGRHMKQKIPVYERICKRCNSKEIEDEIHFLLSCKFNNTLRKTHLQWLFDKFTFLYNMTREQQFIWLMSNPEEEVIVSIAKMVYESMHLRNKTKI